MLRKGGNKGGKKHRDRNAHGLKPIAGAEEQQQIQPQRQQQHLDNGIAEIGEKLPQKAVVLLLFKQIRAVESAGCLHLARRQASCLVRDALGHGLAPFFFFLPFYAVRGQKRSAVCRYPWGHAHTAFLGNYS